MMKIDKGKRETRKPLQLSFQFVDVKIDLVVWVAVSIKWRQRCLGDNGMRDYLALVIKWMTVNYLIYDCKIMFGVPY
jgi:hypothetical protein